MGEPPPSTAERHWCCARASCRAVLGVIGVDGLTIRQHARRGDGLPRVIRVPWGHIEQLCYKCGTANTLDITALPARR